MSRIFFITPDINVPSGGIKQLYRQVDILNINGFQAFILHKKKGFRCSWFKNETKVKYHFQSINGIDDFLRKDNKKFNILKTIGSFKNEVVKLLKFNNLKNDLKNKYKYKDVVFDKEDIIVFPEVYGKAIDKFFLENQKVIYNQNCYYTFWGCDFVETSSPYLNRNIKAVMVASVDAINYLNYGFPNVPLYRVKYGIDEKVFAYYEGKKKQIAVMPRKLSEDVVQVLNLLNFRKILNGWTFKIIDKMDENQVANALKESTFFLSFNHREGFGMPPAEAMACGCIVIGYTGRGGSEFFKDDFCYSIEDRDVVSFAKTLEKVILEYEKDNQLFIEKGKRASEFILSEYSMEMEEKTVVDCWNSILN
jgi:glycosyltransferase involved in cell wall biosynthesis